MLEIKKKLKWSLLPLNKHNLLTSPNTFKSLQPNNVEIMKKDSEVLGESFP